MIAGKDYFYYRVARIGAWKTSALRCIAESDSADYTLSRKYVRNKITDSA